MVFEKLRAILAELLDLSESDISLDSDLGELGMGTYDLIDMVMSIEDEFGVEVPDEALEGFNTVEDVVGFIEG